MRNKRRGRGRRSVSVKHSMHLVLRSSIAKGPWSFVRPQHRAMIKRVLGKHSSRLGVRLLGIGNAGNHLHLRAQFESRGQYMRFVRAITGEIALHIKRSPWSKHHDQPCPDPGRSLWDRRPFSSIVSSVQYAQRLVDYIRINDLEGDGHTRAFARLFVKKWPSTA